MTVVDNKYAALEEQLLKTIGEGANRFNAICSDVEVIRQVKPFIQNGSPIYRFVENRMRSLRNRNRLSYNSKNGWRVSSV